MKSNNVLKHLIIRKKNKAGRNHHGRITVRHRGGGHKRLYRKVNFNFESDSFQILSNEYDPNRNTTISVVKCLSSGKFDYILSNKDFKPGDIISTKNRITNGGRYSLKDLPPNYLVSNIEFKPKKGGQISRSSGMFCKILQKDYDKSLVRIKLPSLEERYVHMACKATVGSVTNNFCHIKKLKKAGNSRWLGKRPKVRGVAMNPIDHPHGGGEGKTSGGRCSVTPWGKLTIGKVTRSKRKYTNSLIFKNRRQF
jgi:large subunit ribosomal protein L2